MVLIRYIRFDIHLTLGRGGVEEVKEDDIYLKFGFFWDRQTHTQTDKQTDRHADRQTDRHCGS